MTKPKASKKVSKPLFEDADWNFDTLRRTYDAIEDIALNELELSVYPNQIEIISAEQMLDAYSSVGMPLMYAHWSYGKHFVANEIQYRKGLRGLAYEIVINSSPCISYNMEENTMAQQTLVMAHAAFGHNHFFKNNQQFLQWTDAEGILDYLNFAKSYITQCEERYGVAEVESVLDAAHALMSHGVFRYRRPQKLSLKAEEERRKERIAYEERMVHYLWDGLTSLAKAEPNDAQREAEKRKHTLHLPEENLLYFLEQYSPILHTWQREVLRIVRNIAQYFYPQRQTKVMNEGCACFVHYYITNRMHEKGQLTDGTMLEILHNHSNVITQPDFDEAHYGGFNPYALGFAMMEDIKRICLEPTEEDYAWFPEFAGNRDWKNTIKDAWANYRDESFITQFLSPHVIRKFRMFTLSDEARAAHVQVSDIHNEQGYINIREKLARTYDIAIMDPDIQVVDVDLLGDRCLKLQHLKRDGIALNNVERDKVLSHLRKLWGYDVAMEEVEAS
ncbi:SpoVR family protein [Rhodobacteraceae bacterium RKSG542]|uniref:SpoVR family protein n=1 Tax=Pseudovibrio flavus TaxID=2529854 RepID=UPI0012BD78ED|nr:SpoVR family protein [Pseudovibrio flavus]MTI18238.1 SpoVR family protein [Pseudovibrio flavus]